MLGIGNYNPTFWKDMTAFRLAEGPRLHALVGEPIRNTWAMWCDAIDEWFCDGPVILQIGSDQLELAAFELGFAATWNIIDRSKPLRWYADKGEDDSLRLCWKEQSPQPLRDAVGKRIDRIELVECQTNLLGHDGWVFSGIGVSFDGGYIEVFNALDELGIASERRIAPSLRRTFC